VKAQARQNTAGRLITRMMPGIQSTDAERCEGARHNGLGSFAAKAAAPESGAKLEAQLVDTLDRVVWPKPAAADVFPGLEQEDGPVLDSMLIVAVDLPLETLAHLLCREWAAG
jgi:hypothetical protein